MGTEKEKERELYNKILKLSRAIHETERKSGDYIVVSKVIADLFYKNKKENRIKKIKNILKQTF